MEQDEVRIPTEIEWALWKQFAEDGNAEAQYQLGHCYANGLGVEIDMVEAVRWFTLAAEQGMAMAQCALGNCYYYGYGVDYDCMKAVEWYVEAADRGLGKALHWYQLAEEHGYDIGGRLERLKCLRIEEHI